MKLENLKDSIMRSARWQGLLMGVFYGLTLRLLFAMSPDGLLQIISTAFMLLVPFAVGAVAVLVDAQGEETTFGHQMFVSSWAMFWFLISMFLLFLEGLICIVLVTPVFMVAALIGGAIAGAVNNFRASRANLPVFALLPLIFGVVEAQQPPQVSDHQVVTSIEINATPEVVFDRLATVQTIEPHELGFSFMHWVGLPRPLEATMNGSGVGAIRTAHWEKGVQFQEEITQWQRPSKMHYQFHIPPGSIPREALDEHVEVGGKYFTVVKGGYDVYPTSRGTTQLVLSTTYRNQSYLQTYGNLWATWVFNDFHYSILTLMKRRAEAVQAEELRQKS